MEEASPPNYGINAPLLSFLFRCFAEKNGGGRMEARYVGNRNIAGEMYMPYYLLHPGPHELLLPRDNSPGNGNTGYERSTEITTCSSPNGNSMRSFTVTSAMPGSSHHMKAELQGFLDSRAQLLQI